MGHAIVAWKQGSLSSLSHDDLLVEDKRVKHPRLLTIHALHSMTSSAPTTTRQQTPVSLATQSTRPNYQEQPYGTRQGKAIHSDRPVASFRA